MFKKLFVILMVITSFFMVGCVNSSETVEIKVTGISWEYIIHVQKLITVEEEDSVIPKDGRYKYSTTAIQYYVGNTPIYETKYVYDIERWEKYGTITTEGYGHNPYWEEFSLEKGEPPYNVGATDVAKTEEIYKVTGIVNGKEQTFTVNKSLWEQLNEGDTVVGIVENNHLYVE